MKSGLYFFQYFTKNPLLPILEEFIPRDLAKIIDLYLNNIFKADYFLERKEKNNQPTNYLLDGDQYLGTDYLQQKENFNKMLRDALNSTVTTEDAFDNLVSSDEKDQSKKLQIKTQYSDTIFNIIRDFCCLRPTLDNISFTDRARLVLIMYESLFSISNLPFKNPGLITKLAPTIIEKHQVLGFNEELKSKNHPRALNDGIVDNQFFSQARNIFIDIADAKPEEIIPQFLDNDAEEKPFQAGSSRKPNCDPKLSRHIPFRILRHFQAIKDDIELAMEESKYTEDTQQYYLLTIKAMEKLTLLYSDIGYINPSLVELQTITINEEMARILSDYLVLRESKLGDKNPESLVGLTNEKYPSRLWRTLVEVGIRCPALKITKQKQNEITGRMEGVEFEATLPRKEVYKIFVISKVKAAFKDENRYKNNSISAEFFINSLEFFDAPPPHKSDLEDRREKLKVNIHILLMLQRVNDIDELKEIKKYFDNPLKPIPKYLNNDNGKKIKRGKSKEKITFNYHEALQEINHRMDELILINEKIAGLQIIPSTQAEEQERALQRLGYRLIS